MGGFAFYFETIRCIRYALRDELDQPKIELLTLFNLF